MHVPLRLAVSVPITLVVLGGFIVGLSTAEGRQTHPVYGWPQGLLIGFFAGVAALLLIVPNTAGAIVANRFGADSTVLFVLLLTAGVAAGWLIEVRLLSSLFAFRNELSEVRDLRVAAVMATDVLVLIAIAFFWRAEP